MASCFHCGASPVGVCSRCNALVCAADGTRPTRFKCISCGSAQAAAAGIVQSGSATTNALATAVVRSALLPGESLEDLSLLSVGALVAAGVGLPPFPGGPDPMSGEQVLGAAQDLRRGIEHFVEGPPSPTRIGIMADVLHPDLLPRGIESPVDAVEQSTEVWENLDESSKLMLALGLLMLDRSRPETWPVEMVVFRAGLDPRPGTHTPWP
jgi:hypothetical protein